MRRADVVVRHADFPNDKQREAVINVIQQAFESTPDRGPVLATAIKTGLDELSTDDPPWQCIVGRSYALYVSYAPGTFGYFSVGRTIITVYQV